MSAPAILRPTRPVRAAFSTTDLVIVPNGSPLLAHTEPTPIMLVGSPWHRGRVEDFALSLQDRDITTGTVIMAMPESPDATHYFSARTDTGRHSTSFYSYAWAIEPFTSVTIRTAFGRKGITIFGDPSDANGLHMVIATAEVFADPSNRSAAESWLLREHVHGVVGNLPFDHVLTPPSINRTSLALAPHTRLDPWFAEPEFQGPCAPRLKSVRSVFATH